MSPPADLLCLSAVLGPLSGDFWAAMCERLKPGAFAFVLCGPGQLEMALHICALENVGFVTGFSSIYYARKGDDGRVVVEIILVVMRPLSEKTYLDQALANGKGCSWLDDGRIPVDWNTDPTKRGWQGCDGNGTNQVNGLGEKNKNLSGRFPANVLCSDDALNDGRDRKTGDLSGCVIGQTGGKYNYGVRSAVAAFHSGDSGSYSRYFDLDAWATEHDCATEGHYPKVAAYLITIGSRPGDLVLCGDDTFASVCEKLGRKAELIRPV